MSMAIIESSNECKQVNVVVIELNDDGSTVFYCRRVEELRSEGDEFERFDRFGRSSLRLSNTSLG